MIPEHLTLIREVVARLAPGDEAQIAYLSCTADEIDHVLDGTKRAAYEYGYIAPFSFRGDAWVLYRLPEPVLEARGLRTYASPDRRKHYIPTIWQKYPIYRQVTNVALGKMSLDEVMRLVCAEFDVSFSTMKSKSRTARVCEARHVFLYIAHVTMKVDQVGAAAALGRTHATVINSIYRVKEKMAVSSEYSAKVSKLVETVEENQTIA